MSSVKKKRRRSSLATAKVKLDLSPGIGKGLYRHIDGNLPQEQRLEQLAKLCLKCAVDRVSQETESQELKDHFETVLDEVSGIFTQPDVKEALHAACHMEGLMPNPENQSMDEHIKDMEVRIGSLCREEQTWLAYCGNLETQVQESESKYDQKVLLTSDLSDTQKSLADSYLANFALADLEEVKKQTKDCVNRAYILLTKREQTLQRLEQTQLDINDKLDKALRQLHQKSFANMGSPKRIIQNLIDFPTPPTGPNDVM